MSNGKSNLLATYITYKELYESGKKDVYDVISEFIKYTVIEEKKNHYTRAELADCIETKFGIRVPNLVLHPATRRLSGISRKDKKYYIDYSKFKKDDMFNSIRDESIKLSEHILNQCFEYVRNNEPGIIMSYSESEIKNAFLKFLLDDVIDRELEKCFGKYVVHNSDDKVFVEQLNQIRAGHILYVGLSHNENVGSNHGMRNPLIIYLDMEILFNLVGYNGQLYQRIATDFLNIVNQINEDSNGLIKLKYFKETARDIERFFSKAESMVANHEIANPGLPAMVAIIKNCHRASDVVDVFSDFKLALRNMGIYEEEDINYYSSKYDKFNLEDQAIVKRFSESESDYIDNETRLTLVSNINKLRAGENFTDYAFCEAILLTETKVTLQMSEFFITEAETENDRHFVQLAVNMYTLTNVLWYRLNGKLNLCEYPSTVDTVIRAQTVLASIVNMNIVSMYQKSMSEYQDGNLTKEKLIERIAGLRKQSHIPESINADSIGEVAEFLSVADIEQYDEEMSYLSNEKNKAEAKVEVLTNQIAKNNEELKHKKETINKQNIIIQEKERKIKVFEKRNEIEKMKGELGEQNRKIEEYEKSKKRGNLIVKSTMSAIAVFGIIALIVAIKLIGWDKMDMITYVLGIVYAGVVLVVNLWKTNFGVSVVLEWFTNMIIKKKRLDVTEDERNSLVKEIKKLELELEMLENQV